LTKKKSNIWMYATLIIVLLGGLYFAGNTFGWWATAPTDVEGGYVFNVFYENNMTAVDEEDCNIYPFYCDVSGMTDAQKEDALRDYSLYTIDSAIEPLEAYDYDADFYVSFLINGTGLLDYWVINPSIGETNVYVIILCGDVGLTAYSTDELDSGIVNSTYDKWTILTQTLDDTEGTGTATDVEGYKAYDNFALEDWNTPVLKVSFNTTASASYVDLLGSMIYSTVVSGNDVYFEIKTTIRGLDTFNIKFSSSVGYEGGATVAPAGFGIGYYSASAYTSWDTYTTVAV